MTNPIGKASQISFLEATVIRRSTVELKKESTIPDARIVEIVKHSLLHSPSPFHVQSARAVVLLHQDHDKLWDIAYEHTSKTAPPELFNTKLSPNLKAFKQAYGTVLFYDDPEAVNGMPPMLGNLIKGFPEWGQQSNGIAQYTAWTAFCAEGLGCSLQHYQKGLTERINAEWGLPSHWVLSAQLVFGTPNGPPRGGVEKQFADIEPRVKVFGSAANGN
ncbi:MAG: hypothetical protein ALECFALPRED_007367 [Alectoria fallacina]|uniref:Nitroreductase domain-containing protein n=1 Tax=Alectoria fallacina TaxID=1903189 RepID=A0A8H3IY18_9LECA|nr:MAG: hypothetical protein ALECFALPRED_007367 [Alectoria fallacina]